MQIYTEVGVGNKSFISTEIEMGEGEYRVRGFVMGKFVSLYLRVWIGRRVVIVDSREGVKFQSKGRSTVKVLLGVHMEEL